MSAPVAASGKFRCGRSDGRTVIAEDDEILYRVQREVLDPHVEVVHDQPHLGSHAAQQPGRHQPTRRTEFLKAFANKPPTSWDAWQCLIVTEVYGRW
jgi:hypothetical protein